MCNVELLPEQKKIFALAFILYAKHKCNSIGVDLFVEIQLFHTICHLISNYFVE